MRSMQWKKKGSSQKEIMVKLHFIDLGENWTH